MISYAEPPTENCWKLYREYGIEIMADSGAYSAWKRGIELSLEGYMNWLTENDIKQYFNMDVVGDPAASMANLQKMEAAGFTPIPVFHLESIGRFVRSLSLFANWYRGDSRAILQPEGGIFRGIVFPLS